MARSSSYAPIFQVMFVLQERALDRTRALDKVGLLLLLRIVHIVSLFKLFGSLLCL